MIVGGSAAALAVAGVAGWGLFKPSSASAEGTIAVLPFQNLSGDPAQAYFSDGVAEEIRSALARVAGLKVAGSTSSEAVRNDDAETAAKKLGVANILTGSVRQSPSTIRVSAELIDGRTGLDKWSQDYDRNPGDAIKIQTDIASNVASALSAALGEAARAAVSVGGTNNAVAQKLYLKAKAQFHSDDSENSLRTAIGLLDSAIDLDPKFADAYATKSRVMGDLSGYYTAVGGNFGPGYAQAGAVAQQAISIAPNLAAGHMALAYARLGELDIGAAATEFERGHALAGGSVDDLLDYGTFLWILGRPDEALDIARQAENQDPLNPGTFGLEAASQRSLGRFDETEAAYRKVLALKPKALLDRAFYAITLSYRGKFDEALAQFRQLPPDYLFRLVGESIQFARQGNRAASDAALQRLQKVYGDSSNYQYADIHAQRGEKDEAFASLDRAWSFRDPGLAYMKSDVWLAPIRSDPRFTAFLRKMNFPSA
jgi:serine/threonine-protein kinase